MTTATTTAPVSTEPVSRGFALHCPLCGKDGTIRLDLDDLERCTCMECDEEFTLTDLRERMAEWAKLLAWVDLAPAK